MISRPNIAFLCTLVVYFRVKITNINSSQYRVYMLNQVTIMAVWIFLLLLFTHAIAEKRILLNDPALVQSQVHALERKMEDVVSNLTAKYNDLNTKYTDQSVKYTELSTKYIEMSTKYSDQSIKLTDLSAKYTNLSAMLTNSNAGVIFIRWGRTVCPGHNTELVYSGFARGSYAGHSGAAAEFVCLPRDPDLTTKFSSHSCMDQNTTRLD